MDFEELSFDKTNAIYCTDQINKAPIDLAPFIVFYKSEQIFVSAEEGTDNKECGKRSDPCATLSESVRHLNEGSSQKLFVMGKANVSVETIIRSVTVQAVGDTQAVVLFD
ncbi:uncharacterized protein MONOS_4016 [Monocercomonoides exilis]|uniref:uncharacterized protein n=1 Tax=Monocercomonoides exilis TaxID=2049356 RepID=UPI003559716F|nr:hypothetical protein MONOS_4016 [Monocercomonoides exilis]|eukprot:MONOS_4016.1-p1 / transcript=MONOS_4016.1 / gene=MONOS_4016 / organism=Monocercomonoides_exilis_PA203 / gene_product=unspecified product / transcript_product=unspecified product / location=Mono_scaffold00101:88207-88536(-) / protein_length=110 / sequence_SO=supercontig / SO=protein_coding / is_pseudo=false